MVCASGWVYISPACCVFARAHPPGYTVAMLRRPPARPPAPPAAPPARRLLHRLDAAAPTPPANLSCPTLSAQKDISAQKHDVRTDLCRARARAGRARTGGGELQPDEGRRRRRRRCAQHQHAQHAQHAPAQHQHALHAPCAARALMVGDDRPTISARAAHTARAARAHTAPARTARAMYPTPS